MTRYAVAKRRNWVDGPVADASGAIIVGYDRLFATIAAMTGRNPMAVPSVSRVLRRKGRVYIAGSRHGQGIIVERID